MASIHQLILNGRLSQLNILLSKTGSHVNERDSAGRTPLHLAVLSNQENYGYRVAYLLLQAHANINVKDFQQQTPVFYACLLNRSKLLLLFYQIKSLDWEQIDVHGYSILHHAATASNLSIFKDIVQKMKASGAAIDGKTLLGYTPLLLAIKSSRFDNAIYLLDSTDVSPMVSDNEFCFTCQQWAQQVKPKSNQSSFYSDDTYVKSLEENTYTPDIVSPRHKDMKSLSFSTTLSTDKADQLWNELMQRLQSRIVCVQKHPSIRQAKVLPWHNERLDSNKQVISLINHYASFLTTNSYQQVRSNFTDRPKSILQSKDSKTKYPVRKEVTFALD